MRVDLVPRRCLAVARQLALPFDDLRRVQLELRAQLGQRLVVSQGRLSHPCLERRTVRATGAVLDFLTIENSFSPSRRRPSIVPGVSTYRAVQICGTTSACQALSLGARKATSKLLDDEEPRKASPH